MDNDKVKRTYYLEPETVKALNNYVVSYCADPDTGSTYGAHSEVVSLAINAYTAPIPSWDMSEADLGNQGVVSDDILPLDEDGKLPPLRSHLLKTKKETA